MSPQLLQQHPHKTSQPLVILVQDRCVFRNYSAPESRVKLWEPVSRKWLAGDTLIFFGTHHGTHIW
jgi:hypothetical protein